MRRSRTVVGGVLLAGALLAVSGGMASAASASWEPVAAPQPPNQLWHTLSSVSCPSASFCMAVGTNNIENYSQPLAETSDGTTWTLRHPLRAEARSQFEGVSCVSATDCTAVGEVSASDDSYPQPLAEQWNGRTWRVETTPMFPGYGEFQTVSCPSASTCFASGSRSDGQGFFERWQSGGRGWSATLISPSLWASISDLSCVSSRDCVAVGSGSVRRDGKTTAVIESWNGTAWTALTLSATDDPDGISCSSSTSCVVVGGAGHQSFSEVLSGRTWSSHNVPEIGTGTLLDGVTCLSATSCTGVGSAVTDNRGEAIVEHWNGTSWSVENVVQEKSSVEPALAGVSCPTGTACDAVGSYEVSPVKGYGQVNLLVEQGPAT